MSNFKPSLSYITPDSVRLAEYQSKRKPYVFEYHSTYAKVKRRVKDVLKHDEPIGGVVNVSRSRRGEWGEWFETWELVNGKPKIVKEGWM